MSTQPPTSPGEATANSLLTLREAADRLARHLAELTQEGTAEGGGLGADDHPTEGVPVSD